MIDSSNNIGWTREEMAEKVALDIPDGSYVNLGIGIPELVADYVPEDREVIYQTENGLLGMGKVAEDHEEDRELVNAGKKCITAVPGASFFHHADSFAMIRGGHIDICILGTMQVSKEGDLANWSTGKEDAVPAVGGAMDLVAGVKRVIVIMDHTNKSGDSKILKECTLPLTGKSVVHQIITNLCVFNVKQDGLEIIEYADGVDRKQIEEATEAKILN